MKYRKRPIVVEAWPWPIKPPDAPVLSATETVLQKKLIGQWVETLEGGHLRSEGDWLIKGVKGEFYPCKSDIFDATYEPVEEDQPS